MNTIPPIAKLYVEHLSAHCGSPLTVREYTRDLTAFLDFLADGRDEEIDVDFLRSVTRARVNSYSVRLHNSGLASATISRRLAVARSFFGFLTDTLEVLDRNPASGLTVARQPKKLPVFFSAEECRRLLDAVDGINRVRDYAIVLLALSSGLRVSEIVSLNVSDLRTENGHTFFRVTGKGSKERQVFIGGNVVDALNRYLPLRETEYGAKDDALFVSRKHGRMSVRAVQDLVWRYTEAAGLTKASPHKLRHTAATLMLEGGVDLRTISEVMGHSSVATTQIYTHVGTDRLAMACAASPASGF